MRCPRCKSLAPHPQARCSECHFHLEALNDALIDAPARSATLVDDANVMSEAGYSQTVSRLQEFSRQSGHDAVVVTLSTTAPLTPSEYAFGLFERWKVGGQRRDGLMLCVAVKEQQVECVLGPALQPALTEPDLDALLVQHAVPHFARGDYSAGVFCGLDMLARVFEHIEGLR